jgi:hypothetical protein
MLVANLCQFWSKGQFRAEKRLNCKFRLKLSEEGDAGRIQSVKPAALLVETDEEESNERESDDSGSDSDDGINYKMFKFYFQISNIIKIKNRCAIVKLY